MKFRPNERLIELVDVADSDAALDSAGLTEKETARVQALRQLIFGLKVPKYDAPISTISAAQRLFEPTSRTTIAAQIVRASLGWAGARAETAEAFQVSYMLGDGTLRLSVERDSSGWQILGKLSRSGYEVEIDGTPIDVDESGRFEYKSGPEAPSKIVIIGANSDFVLPSFEELFGNDGNERDSGD